MSKPINQPLTIERCRKLQRAVHEIAKPYIRLKCDILNVATPTYVLSTDSTLSEVLYSEETNAQLREVDKLLEEAVTRFLRTEGVEAPTPADLPKKESK